MSNDKKNKSGNIYMILLAEIGRVNEYNEGKVATVVRSEIIIQALSTFGL